LTLARVTEIASAWEILHQQARAMEKGGATGGHDVCVNEIRAKPRKFSKPNYSNTQKKKPSKENSLKKCYRCDNVGHFARDTQCPARKEVCRKCDKVGHYARCCKSTPSTAARGRPG
jgi:hypothetical protein